MGNNHLLRREDVALECVKFLFGILATAVGFFFALYLNNRIETQKERETYRNIKKSIKAEIIQNRQTLDSSFYKYIDGIILNEFNTATSTQQMTNYIFLKYSNSDLLISVQGYIRKCDLCNKLKNQLKDFRVSGDRQGWGNNIKISLTKAMSEVDTTLAPLINQLHD